MKFVAIIMLAVLCLMSLAAFPVHVSGGSDDFQSLEFFLDKSLKKARSSTERNEISNRYLIKALGLVYQQNKEQIRLNRETLQVLRELREIEIKAARELESHLSKR